MLKLKTYVVEQVNKVVKDEYLKSVVNESQREIKSNPLVKIEIEESMSKCGLDLTLTIHRYDFYEVEDLKTGVWYPVSKFDGNPNNYWVIEYFSDDSCGVSNGINGNELCSVTTHFMYIKSLDMLKQSTDN